MLFHGTQRIHVCSPLAAMIRKLECGLIQIMNFRVCLIHLAVGPKSPNRAHRDEELALIPHLHTAISKETAVCKYAVGIFPCQPDSQA